MNTAPTRSMTRQQAFDTVVRGLAAQGWAQSFLPSEPGVTCAYRGSNGLRCAAGHLITDDQYKPVIERSSVAEIVANFPGVLPTISDPTGDVSYQLLSDMQIAHDQATSPYWMYLAMLSVGERNNLVWPADVRPLNENGEWLPS